MHKIIAIDEALKLEDALYIDMRSPGEYETGHIPGAINIPLFTNEERAEVGTIYKNVGVEEAKTKGLGIVSAKLPELVSKIRAFYKKNSTVIIYCWRGGMRSKSVVTILEIMGITAFQLSGGYKAYRRYVLDSLEEFKLNAEMVVLCGSTGVGKTLLLKKLEKLGVGIIDLEGLANHRGSAFGQVGLGKPETAQNFDAKLLKQLQQLNNRSHIVVECESKRVGNVYLPDVLYSAMKKGKKVLVKASIDTRVERLIKEYTGISENYKSILDSLSMLKKRLGSNKTQQLKQDFEDGRIQEMVRTLLIEYYDPLYGYEQSDLAEYNLVVDAEDLDQAALLINNYLNQQI